MSRKCRGKGSWKRKEKKETSYRATLDDRLVLSVSQARHKSKRKVKEKAKMEDVHTQPLHGHKKTNKQKTPNNKQKQENLHVLTQQSLSHACSSWP